MQNMIIIYKFWGDKTMIYSLHEKVDTHKLLDVHKSIAIEDADFISFVSGNAFESLARTNPEYFDQSKLKAIRDGENIVEEFNNYFMAILEGNMEKVKAMTPEERDSYTSLSMNNVFIVNVMMNDYNLLKEEIGEVEAKRAVAEMYIPQSLSEEGCKRLINIRINNNKFLTECMVRMIKYNYLSLGISAAEAGKLIDTLKDDATSWKGYETIKKLMENPSFLNKYRLGKNNYDFRPLGGACIFLSADPTVQNAELPTKHLYKMYKYDAVVVAHGGYRNHIFGNPLKYLRDGKSRDWSIQPVDTLTKTNLRTAIDVMRALKDEGFKNVYIGCCNPGHVTLPKDIIEDKNFNVTMGLDSVLMESSEMVINEGILSSAKDFIKHGTRAVIDVFKATTNRISKLFTSFGGKIISTKFGGKKMAELPKPIEVGCMYVSGGVAKYKIETARTPNDLQSIIDDANKTFVNNLNTLSKREYDHINKLFSYMNKKPVTSTDLDNMFEGSIFLNDGPAIEYTEEVVRDNFIEQMMNE